MKLIHVHGFAELAPESLITAEYRKHAKRLKRNLKIQEFKWNTLDSNPTRLPANFIESEKRTKEAALRLAEVISAESEPLVLSGYSLGGAILLETLALYPECPNLHSAVLLGTAYPRSQELKQLTKIKPRHYALNYYSPQWDSVLQTPYYSVMGDVAIGRCGFLNPGVFQNLKVGCHHDGYAGYSRLAPGIIGLLAHSAGVKSKVKAEKSWLFESIGNNDDWDSLIYRDGHIIQRHFLTGHFRIIEAGGIYQTRFHGECVISLMDELALLPG
jgi:pimeloyl-ACP methyl ester carboxylesterase